MKMKIKNVIQVFRISPTFLSGHVQGKAKYELMCEIFLSFISSSPTPFPTQKSVFNNFSCIADRFLNR